MAEKSVKKPVAKQAAAKKTVSKPAVAKKPVAKKAPAKKVADVKKVAAAPVMEKHPCGCDKNCACGGTCAQHAHCKCRRGGFFKKLILFLIIFALGFAAAKMCCCGKGKFGPRPEFDNGCLVIKCAKLAQMAPMIDTDQNGCITREEFKAAKKHMRHGERAHEMPAPVPAEEAVAVPEMPAPAPEMAE